jgi:hypothetical protein
VFLLGRYDKYFHPHIFIFVLEGSNVPVQGADFEFYLVISIQANY